MDREQWLSNLLRENEGPLLRFLCRSVSQELAREIVQEVYLRLWKEEVEHLAGREKAWLFTVARNLMLDVLRKEGNMSSESLDDCKIASEEANASQAIEANQERENVSRLVKELPEKQQEVVRLKFQEGFSYKEIAEITGHSVSHVGVLLHEAMQRLKAEIVSQSQPAAIGRHGGRQ